MAARGELVLLEIHVDKGHNLAAKDLNGLSDPFVVVKVDSREVFRSTPVWLNLNPEWSATAFHICQRPAAPGQLPTVEVEVWDYDLLSHSDFMGYCAIPASATAPTSVALRNREGSKHRVSGEVVVHMRVSSVAHDCRVIARDSLYRCVLAVDDRESARHPRILCLSSARLRGCAALGANSTVSREGLDGRTVVLVPAPASKPVSLACPTLMEAQALEAALAEYVRRGALSRIFGAPLSVVAQREPADEETGAPWFVADLCRYAQRGVAEVGIFRQSGQADRMSRLHEAIEAHDRKFLESVAGVTVHDAACLLKEYLRELPEPLVPRELQEQLLAANAAKDNELQRALIAKMPRENHRVLRCVMRLLHEVALNSHRNMMKPSNIGIVVGMSIMPPPADADPIELVAALPLVNGLAQTLVEQYPYLLGGAGRRQALSESGHLIEQRNNLPVPREASIVFSMAEKVKSPRYQPDDGCTVEPVDELQAENAARSIVEKAAGKSGKLEGKTFEDCFRSVLQAVPPALSQHFDAACCRKLLQQFQDNNNVVTKEEFMAWWRDCLSAF